MAEPVVIVSPAGRGQQDVERGDGCPPGQLRALLEPLGVLHRHRGRHHGKGFVAREEPVPPGEDIALEPALAVVLAEHLHHAALGRDVVVGGDGPAHEAAVRRLEDVTQAVGVGLVGAEEPEVGGLGVSLEDVPHHLAELPRRLVPLRRGLLHRERVVGEVRKIQVHEDSAAIGMRVGAHPAVACGGQGGERGGEAAALVEQLLRPVTPHPGLEHFQVRVVLLHGGQRDLVSAERALDRHPVHDLRSGPALGCPQHEDRPPGPPAGRAAPTRLGLDGADLRVAGVQSLCEPRVHDRRIVTLDKVGLVAMTLEEARDLRVVGPAQDGGPGDLVLVEVQDRQHRTVPARVEEADALPGALQGSRLCLAVANHGGHEQVRVVEGRAEGMGEHIAELAALVDRARGGNAHMARHAAGRGELAEESTHALEVARDLRVDLRIRSLEVNVGHDGGTAVPGPRQIDRAGVGLLHQAVEMRVDETQARRRPPVPEEPRLDVLGTQRLPQQRIVLKIDLADRQVVGRPPVRVEALHLLFRDPHTPSPLAGSAGGSRHGSQQTRATRQERLRPMRATRMPMGTDGNRAGSNGI